MRDQKGSHLHPQAPSLLLPLSWLLQRFLATGTATATL